MKTAPVTASFSAASTAACFKVSTIAIDLAKDVFQVAHADEQGRVIRQQRLKSREQFVQAMAQWVGKTVVMESGATANFYGRALQNLGFTVKLLPAQRVSPYRGRNKTDAADTLAMLQASRNAEIKNVPVKSENAQVMVSLHALREAYKATRVAHINALRSHCREYGVVLPLSTEKAIKAAPGALENLPLALHAVLHTLVAAIRTLEHSMTEIECQIKALTEQTPAALLLQSIPGIGLLTSSALVASAVGPEHFKDGRSFSAWLGLTPKEHSSGNTRWLGGISKQGNPYVRTLIIHGARSALAAALMRQHKAPSQLSVLQEWALALLARRGMNIAVVALANKMLRLAWRLWKDGACYTPRLRPSLPAVCSGGAAA